jgi:hypothetical protein
VSARVARCITIASTRLFSQLRSDIGKHSAFFGSDSKVASSFGTKLRWIFLPTAQLGLPANRNVTVWSAVTEKSNDV